MTAAAALTSCQLAREIKPAGPARRPKRRCNSVRAAACAGDLMTAPDGTRDTGPTKGWICAAQARRRIPRRDKRPVRCRRRGDLPGRGDRRTPVTRRPGPRAVGGIRSGPRGPIRAGAAAGRMTGGGRRPGETYAPAPRQHPGPGRGRAQAGPWLRRSAARTAPSAVAGIRRPGRARVPIGRPVCPTC